MNKDEKIAYLERNVELLFSEIERLQRHIDAISKNCNHFFDQIDFIHADMDKEAKDVTLRVQRIWDKLHPVYYTVFPKQFEVEDQIDAIVKSQSKVGKN